MNISRSYKMSWRDFLKATSPNERKTLREELNFALSYFLGLGKAVYLEQFGILEPVTKDIHSAQIKENRIYQIQKKERTLEFEKCLELTDFHRQKLSHIIETPTISRRVYSRLSLSKQIKWDERIVAKFIRTIILAIKDEVILEGHSTQLASIGTLYALHNRQGYEIRDWFAGSDIFIAPACIDLLQVLKPKELQRPELLSACEPFEALHGKPISTFTIDIKKELRELGYDVSLLDEEVDKEQQKFTISVFKNEYNRSYLSSTDGFRFINRKGEKPKVGNEIVFQLAFSQASKKLGGFEWQSKLFTLAWLLIAGRPNKPLYTGLTLSTDSPLIKDINSTLYGIFVTTFSPIKLEQLTKDQPFQYMNITGITPDEARVAESYSPVHLYELLKFKKYDQITTLQRASVTHKTSLITSAQNATIQQKDQQIH